MQMLLYLYCVIRGQNIPDSNTAGIFYKPSKRDTHEKGLAMNGMLPADEEIVRAMEKEGLGEFVPKLTIKKDGTVSKQNDSFVDMELFTDIFNHIERVMKNIGNSISCGDIPVNPVNGRETDACKYCDFKLICGIEDTEIPKVEKLSNDKIKEILRAGDNSAN